jgi:hypothetical protein
MSTKTIPKKKTHSFAKSNRKLSYVIYISNCSQLTDMRSIGKSLIEHLVSSRQHGHAFGFGEFLSSERRESTQVCYRALFF